VDLVPDPKTWLPHCPTPDRLYNVYANTDSWRLVASARSAAERDVASLQIPTGLPRHTFERFVAAMLRQMPLIAKIDQLAISGISPQQAEELIRSDVGDEKLPYEIPEVWQTPKAWLTYFFPTEYRIRTGSDVLVRGRVIWEQ
jgi:hypothetical protein